MKKFAPVVFLTFSAFFCAAQNKMLTIEDALAKNKTTLAPEHLRQLQFLYGTDDYVYLKNINGKDIWVRGNFKSDETTFLSLDQLNQKLKTGGSDTLSAMPEIQFNQSAEWITTIKENKIAIDPVTGKIRKIIDRSVSGKQNLEESSSGYVAYVDNYNLYIANGSHIRRITSDGSHDIVYTSAAYSDEFGIAKGTFWSNNGKLLAFYRMDRSMVSDYPIIDWSQRPAKNINIKYAMVGEKSHYVTVGVYNAETQSMVYLKTGEPAEQYLTNITWSPDDKYIFIAIVNKAQNHVTLNQYEAASGHFMKTVFEEHDDKYVEPMAPVLFVKNNPSQFIWQSSRDGWNHLYLYSLNGVLLKQLTKGNWEVVDVKGFDTTGENLFYSSTEESPLTRNLYQLNLKTGVSARITKGFMVHDAKINTTGNFIINSFSTVELPATIQLVDIKNAKTKLLFNSPNPLSGYSIGALSVFPINNKTGIPLYCRMYKPLNFDSTKKYPVIVYWYGGPHKQLINAGWNGGASDYWFQYMSQREYIVFSIDTRGSDYRGKAFEQSMFKRIGDVQLEDMMSGVGYLQSLPYVDQKNMGLFGSGFGGFNTINFMLRYPNVFKVAVAADPVTDWSYYEVKFAERYMDTPQENPQGYSATDLTKQVDRLKGKLLLLDGLQHPFIQQHSMRFLTAAMDKNIQVDYMIYPAQKDDGLGKRMAYLYQKITDYFMQHLR